MRKADSLMAMARNVRSRAPAPPGAQPQAPLGGTRAEALRRLQTGILGVVGVVLLIGLASIIRDRATATDSTAVAEAASTTAPSAATGNSDPLAEAGVVPEIPASPTVSPAAAAPQPGGGPAAAESGNR